MLNRILTARRTRQMLDSQMKTRLSTVPVTLISLVVCVAGGQAQEPLDFAHQILPVLKQHCAECHSNGVFKGGLSLETRASLLDSGTVEERDRHNSDLFERIISDDPDYRMPPEGDRLSAEQIEAIGRWIDEGLGWPDDLGLKQAMFRRSLPLDFSGVAAADSRHPVDWHVDSYFSANGIEAPTPIADSLYLRRLKLDLLGLLPTQEETEQFIADQDPGKHEKWVNHFLARDRDYADHWMSFWNDLLRNDYVGTGYIDGGRQQITRWLHQSLMQNKAYDQMVRELIKPDANSIGFIKGIKWRGEVNASQIRPLQFSQNISQVFLGINMKCASCHDSFIDEWKLEDAYGLAAVIAEQPLEIHRCDVPTGNTATSGFVFPELGEIDQSLSQPERLQQLSELMTSRQNGRFARTIVNRLWQRLAGRGLVHPVDVMANEAWSEALLNELAVQLVDNGYDLKRILKLIATSRVYRSSSVSLESQSNQDFVFRGVQAKRMTAEQFVDSVWQLTGRSGGQQDAGIEDQSREAFVRAALVRSDALMRSLGRPNREQVVTTRPAELSTLQALDLTNGQILADWIRTGAAKWKGSIESERWEEDVTISTLFRQATGQVPGEQELALLASDDEQDLQIWLEDLIWIVVMLPEFQMIQ